MAKYKSQYQSLGFYCEGNIRYFNGGTYETVNAKELEVLDAITDVSRIDEEPKSEAKPAPKAPAKRTASAK